MSDLNITLLTMDKNGFKDMPFCSHIEGNLYVGMSPVYWPVQDHYRFPNIFNFYTFEDYPVMPHQKRVDMQMFDSHDQSLDRDETLRIGAEINRAQEFGKVLVHCQMGINRSNVFAAASLILKGYTPQEAIKLLREKRSEFVLMNKAFELFVLTLEKP